MTNFFSLCDPNTKEVVKVLQTDYETATANANGLLVIPGHSKPRTFAFDDTQGKLVQKADNQLLVERGEITAFRAMLEFLPLAVEVAGQTCFFDVDILSQHRMQKALEHWDLNVLVNGRIEWVLANNSAVFLNHVQLTNVMQEIERRVATRRAKLHAHAQTLIRRLPNVSKADLKESEWPQ